MLRHAVVSLLCLLLAPVLLADTNVFPLNGNVGIGTTSPLQKLTILQGHVALDNGYQLIGHDATNSYYFRLIGADSSNRILLGDTTNSVANEIQFHTNGNAAPTVDISTTGNLGIGTGSTAPLHRLTVGGGHIALDNSFQIIGHNSTSTFYYQLIGNDASDRINVGDMTNSIPNEIRFHTNGNAAPTVLFATSGNVGIGTGTTAPAALFEASKASSDSVLLQEVARLSRTGGSSLAGAVNNRGTLLSFYDASNPTLVAAVGGIREVPSGNYNGGLAFYTNNTGGANAAAVSQLTEQLRITSAGNVGIGTAAPGSGFRLDVNGNAHVSGDMTVDGNLAAKYQDVAEWVPAGESLQPGTVVVLDRDRDNEVVASRSAYDTAVAGVVSTRPGLILGEPSETKSQIATTGRVIVKVDASRGAIRTGDLLVTSDVVGTAMKSLPIEVAGRTFHQPGTIIGKALQPLPSGQGEILVLLSLQ